jgi:fibronectin-binding autotransporter adhesin
MKRTAYYPKVIIHRLGSPAVISQPRTGLNIWLRLIALAMLLFGARSLHAGTHTWSGAGSNTLWSNAGNWSSGGAPVPGESNLVLIFPANATGFTSTVNVVNLSVDRMEFSRPTPSGTTYTFPNGGTPLTLTGVAGDNVWLKDDVNVIWQPNLTLQNTCRFNLADVDGTRSNFDIQGVVAGNGGLVKQGEGALEFSTGSAANTFTGTLRAEAGRVYLNKIVGTPCFGGNLEIVGGHVYVQRSHQIPDTASIFVGPGVLVTYPDAGVASVTEVIGPVTMGPAAVLRAFYSSTMTLGSSITCESTYGRLIADSPTAKISLGGATRTITLPTASSKLEVHGDVIDGGASAGITKAGPGTLEMRDVTSFTGPVTVAGGKLVVFDDRGLGSSTGATTVQSGATLELAMPWNEEFPAYINEPINLAGTLMATEIATTGGAIVLSGSPTCTASSGKTLQIGGVLSGSAASLNITGAGTVMLGGSSSNTMSGAVVLKDTSKLVLAKTGATAIPGSVKLDSPGATLKLLAPNQMADTGWVWMANGGTFDLNNYPETIAYLYSSSMSGGLVTLGNATLRLNGAINTQFGDNASGTKVTISGSDQSMIHKLGSNTWTLCHAPAAGATAFPTLRVDSGTMELYGTWPGRIQATGGLLRGKATVGPIQSHNGQICLCDFTAASFDGQGTTLVSINGSTPGTSYDRLISTGAVDLMDQTLQLTLGAFTPALSERFTIIQNNSGRPIQGFFDLMPEGAIFTLSGKRFSITYVGGASGRDVQLTYLGIGNIQPRITGLTRVGNTVTVYISGDQGNGTELQKAANGLSGWTFLASPTINSQGLGSFTHTNVQTKGFYRLYTFD